MVNIMVGSADCVIKGQGIVMQIHFCHVISCIHFFYYYQVSWVISNLLWFHVLQYDTPPQGEVLNNDCSLPPSRKGKLSTFTGSFTKFPPLPGVPSREWLMIGA